MKPLTPKDKKTLVFLGIFLVGSIVGMAWLKNYENDLQQYHPIPFTDQELKVLSNNDSRAVFIYPILTDFAYQPHGFYDYYQGKCNSCLTVSLRPYGLHPSYNIGQNAFDRLTQLHYAFVNDLTVDRHPEILNDYDKIILLHNEYMTKKEFDAISTHKNVIYLYPNAEYAQVSVDYKNWTMTLERGHDYPQGVKNGFGFITDTKWEYDSNCKDYRWQQYPNGIALTCFPEYLVTYDRNIFQTIKDYPQISPPLIGVQNKTVDLSDIRYCQRDGTCDQKLDSLLTK